MKKFIVFFIILVICGAVLYGLTKGRESHEPQESVKIDGAQIEQQQEYTQLLDIMSIPDGFTIEPSENPVSHQTLEKDGVIYTYMYEASFRLSNIINNDYNKEYLDLYEEGSHSFETYRDTDIYYARYVWGYNQTPDMIYGDAGDMYLDFVSSPEFDESEYDTQITVNDITLPVQTSEMKSVYYTAYIPLQNADAICLSFTLQSKDGVETDEERQLFEQLVSIIVR